MSANKSTIKLFEFEPRPADWLGVLAVIFRVAMGAWFFYAGWVKVFGGGLNQFVTDIENYRLVNENMAIAIGYFLPFLEIFTGLCFLMGLFFPGAWLAMLGMVIAFSIAVGSAWWRNLDISCGCTGGGEPISYWRKAIEFSAYFIVLFYLIWERMRNSRGFVLRDTKI